MRDRVGAGVNAHATFSRLCELLWRSGGDMAESLVPLSAILACTSMSELVDYGLPAQPCVRQEALCLCHGPYDFPLCTGCTAAKFPELAKSKVKS